MAGVEVCEEVDVAKSAQEGRLRLSRNVGWDYHPVALSAFAALYSGSMDVASYHANAIQLGVALLLATVPLCLLGLAWRLFKATILSHELVPISTGTTNSKTTRTVFGDVAAKLDWEENRNNSAYGRYFFDRYVVTVLFRRDHVLLNCRRTYRNRMRLPVGRSKRDDVVRLVSDRIASAGAPSNPVLNPTGLRPAG
jgi:hypothetical protein